MDHFADTLNPLDIIGRVIPPLAPPDWLDQPFLFVAPQGARVQAEYFSGHADGEECLVVINHNSSLQHLVLE